MKTNYVVGFMFNESMSSVALIRKQKPKWQAGLLNGIGGKVEDGESPYRAMCREFEEETGVVTSDWNQFCSMCGVNNDSSEFEIDFFYRFGKLELLKSMEKEKIEVRGSSWIVSGEEKTIGNLRWLIALAMDFGKGIHPPSHVSVVYGYH